MLVCADAVVEASVPMHPDQHYHKQPKDLQVEAADAGQDRQPCQAVHCGVPDFVKPGFRAYRLGLRI